MSDLVTDEKEASEGKVEWHYNESLMEWCTPKMQMYLHGKKEK